MNSDMPCGAVAFTAQVTVMNSSPLHSLIDIQFIQFKRRISPDLSEDEEVSGASGILSSSTSINRGRKHGGAGNQSRESGVDEPTNKRISLIGSKALSLVGSQYHAIRRTSVARVQTTSHVSIKKVICELDIQDDFATSFVSTNEVIDGFIRDTPFSSGAMKYAFEFSTKSGVQYVAKRFYRLGDQEDENINFRKEQTISINNQKLYMQSELSRLVIGQWFLSAFYRLAKSEDVHVHSNIIFTDAFLGLEDQPTLSVASGHDTCSQHPDSLGEGLTWLIEPKRTKAVQRFSHTLHHKNKQLDLLSLTIAAFSHFVYGHSKSSLVLADIQGSPSIVNGQDGLVLFDIMNHTTEGDSGVGDFGKEGIATFLRDHRCNNICKLLRLHTDVPLNMGNSMKPPAIPKGKGKEKATTGTSKTTLSTHDPSSDDSDDSEPEPEESGHNHDSRV